MGLTVIFSYAVRVEFASTVSFVFRNFSDAHQSDIFFSMHSIRKFERYSQN